MLTLPHVTKGYWLLREMQRLSEATMQSVLNELPVLFKGP